MRQERIRTTTIIVFLSALLAALAVRASGGVETEYYHVVGNKVDRQTFLGWSLFHDTCVVCHGTGGSGTSRAPDLTVSVQRMSPVEFETKVLRRYLISIPQYEAGADDRTALRQALIAEIQKQEARERGETETMPRWESNPIVKERVDNLYRYLKARADGVLGPDRPEILRD